MKVVADELIRLARTTLTASVSVADGWAGSYAALTPPETVAGNTAQGPSLVAAAAAVAEAADVAVGRLVAVCQEDADDLLAVAFDVTTVDEEVAASLTGHPLRRAGAS